MIRRIQMNKPTPSVNRKNRRDFLMSAGALAGAALIDRVLGRAQSAGPRFAADPFSLGVASGDPWPDSVVLWTRLAPDPTGGGGMPRQAVDVRWEIAGDERMRNIVARGTTTARPELGHSLHVEVFGLKPARWYWYRFMSGDGASPVGRTRTAPALNSRVDRLAFAFASCQHYETGFYTAYQHMIAEDLDLVVFLGDYIYEGSAQPGRLRAHNGAEPTTLAEYRNRYGLYKSDPLLKQAHASFPWIVTWDDHEVENNYAGEIDEKNGPRQTFLARRAQAYQAYYEHMPLRPSAFRRGPAVEIYRRLRFGDLMEMNVLDTRKYRTDQPCGDGTKPLCPEALDPKATMMGPAQERWLMRGLGQSRARWNVIAQQVMVAQVDAALGPEKRFSMDKWNGYIESRNRLLDFLHRRKPSNPVVITGDIHTNWAADLKTDFDREDSPIVGAEFVGTSISSGGDGSDTQPTTEQRLAENPHIKFFNAQRGYVRCALTPERWQTDYRVLAAVTQPDAAISTRASFVVENGRAGVKRL
jgi:alkaline phosphatase D